ANKLRSFLTMFGILWGMISVVVLSATGEGFRRGNEKVLRELGKNIAIVWGGRTSLQAGGERAGRQIRLTLGDARALAADTTTLNGLPYTIVGKIRKKNQDSNYSGPDNNKIFVPFAAMSRDMPRKDADPGTLSDIIVAPKEWVVDGLQPALDNRAGRIEDIDWPLERRIRAILARRHGFNPDDRQAIAVWDTSLETLMFGRM